MEKTPDPPERPQPKNTPYSRGTGSHFAYETKNKPDEYKTYLQEDINTCAELPITEFLEVVLKLHKVDWEQRTARHEEYKRISESKDFKEKLKVYTQRVNNERDRYHPFAILVQSILEQLHHKNLKLCRNDPAMVLGSYADRSPDIGVFNNIVFGRGTRFSPDNFSKSGPTGELAELAFHWIELHSFFEHKAEKYDLQDPSPMKKKLDAAIIHTEAQCDDPFTEPPRNASQSAVDSRVSGGESSSVKAAQRNSTCQEFRRTTRSMARGEHGSGGRKRKSGDAQLEVGGSRETKKSRSNGSKGSMSKALNQRQTKAREEYLVQCAGYALEMLSYGGLRSHVIGSLVTDDKLELLYYDRSIHARSEPINIQTEPITLVAIIDAMGNLSDADWGYDDFLEHPAYLTLKDLPIRREGTKDETCYEIFEGSELKLGNGYVLELEEEVFHQHALIGRGTCVVKARVKGSGPTGQLAKCGTTDALKWTQPLIVKFSYGAVTREESEFQITQKLRNIAEREGGDMLDHLPDILWSEERELHGVPARVADYLNQLQSGVYERRKLYVTVQEELFRVKDLVKDGKVEEFWQSIRDISKCYQWVYEKGYLHRDISVGNMMYRLRDEKVFGVLNDYDLSVSRNREEGPTSKQRTGTLPYMSIDLLKADPPNHMYRHDLESIYYCTLDMVSDDIQVLERGHRKTVPAFWKWRELPMVELASTKRSHLFDEQFIFRSRRGFEDYNFIIKKLRRLLQDVYLTLTRREEYTEFDILTCNQAITFEKFNEILMKSRAIVRKSI